VKIIQKSSKKSLIIGAAILLVVSAASLSYYIFSMNGSIFGWQLNQADPVADSVISPTNTVNLEPATNSQKQSGSDAKTATVEKDKAEKTATTDLTVGFTTIDQTKDTLRVRISIQELISNGTCKLTLRKSTDTVTKTAATYATASISTCQGFDIPTSELSKGEWTVDVTVTTASTSGKASTLTKVN